MIYLSRLLFYIISFSITILHAQGIDIENISQKPIFSAFSYCIPMSSENLCKILTPILKKHLLECNYDRSNLIIQYIDHHEFLSKTNPSINPLQSLESFIPDPSLGEFNGSSCFCLNIDLLSKISPYLIAYPVPATWFLYSQQPYWPNLSHIALVIPFYNPINSEDKGYILLDPHLKMDTPLVITLNGDIQTKNLKEKGICTFFYKEGKIISQSNLNSETRNFSMTYYLTEFVNFMESSLKPTLAADRKITLYSRTEDGNVIASLILLLDTNTLRYSLQNRDIKEISFIDFLSHKVQLDDSLADELHIEKEKLYTVIEKILLHKNLLDDLYDTYTDFIKKSPRINDFYIPNFNNY